MRDPVTGGRRGVCEVVKSEDPWRKREGRDN